MDRAERRLRELATRWLPAPTGALATTYRVLERSGGPVVDLLIRLWLAKVFFVSGVLRIFGLSIEPYLSGAAAIGWRVRGGVALPCSIYGPATAVCLPVHCGMSINIPDGS